MHYVNHVVYTWLLAQALHIPISHFWAIGYGSYLAFDEHLQWAFMAVTFSIPALLVCLIVYQPVVKLSINKWLGLLLWGFVAASSVFSTLFLLAAIIGGVGFFFHLNELVLPGCAAAFVSVMIRYRQFFRLKETYVTKLKQEL